MSELTKSPVTIIVMHPHSKSPVWAEKCQVVVFRDAYRQYYFTHQRVEQVSGLRTPLMRRFVIRTHLKPDGSGFETRLSALNFLRVFFPEEKVYNRYG